MTKGIKEPLPTRFWRLVSKSDDPEGCWIWTGYRDPNGYGRVSVTPSRDRLAHRIAWMLTTGEMPKGFLLHRCDNPSCVRPDHMREGTQADNMRDMDAKGRRRTGRFPGELSNFAKLSESDVHEIRNLAARGLPQREIADKFRVAYTNINQIVNRRTWRHV